MSETTMSKYEPLNINDYSDPGEYRQDAAERGGVSLQFCLAVSKIMEKYNLTFPEACHFLEDKGFLSWVEGIPLYNMAGDVLWVDEEQRRIDEEKATQEKEPKPQSIFNPSKEIQCKFFTLVIRNKELEAKYQGGLEAFIDKYLCEYNDDLTTMIAMAMNDLDEPVEDIEESGLTCGEGYTLFDASLWGLFTPEDYSEVELGVSWLRAHHFGENTVICSY